MAPFIPHSNARWNSVMNFKPRTF